MLTWEEIRAHIRKDYRPTSETATSYTLRCEFPDGAEQEVVVTFQAERSGGPRLDIAGPVADSRSFAPTDALAYNLKAPKGALALAGKRFVLRDTLDLKQATLAALDQALTYVASEAMRLHRSTKREPVPAELFSYLAS
ncbi:MAG TPA: hypothetical protein VKE22_05370 [Haliangiales bacterium]|nr:hypothetical protein [Haliangiales bacterium]